MPNRSRSGVASSPARVVAPTSVKGARSIRTLRAAGPSPMMRSSWKSSIAGYSTSSMAGCRRWISSMNSTSRGCRLVRMAARSPARWITGPEVARKPTPSSRATICAKRRLPEAGRPVQQHMVERLAPAARGLDEDARFSRLAFWPMNSASVCGRRLASAGVLLGARGRDGAALAHLSPSSLRLFADDLVERRVLAEPLAARPTAGLRLGPAVAEIEQRRERVLPPPRREGDGTGGEARARSASRPPSRATRSAAAPRAWRRRPARA